MLFIFPDIYVDWSEVVLMAIMWLWGNINMIITAFRSD